MPNYRCKNYGGCTKADRREIIELPPGAPPVCPEPNCRKALVEAPGGPGTDRTRKTTVRAVEGGGGGGGARVLLPAVGAILVLGAIGLAIWRPWSSSERAISLKVAPTNAGQVGLSLEVPISVEPTEAAGATTLTVTEGSPPPGVKLVDGTTKLLVGVPTTNGAFTVKIVAHANGYQDATASVAFTIARAAGQPPPERPDHDLVLAGSNTIGGVDAASNRGLARDLIIEFFRQRGALGPPEEKQIPVPGEDEKNRSMTFRLGSGEIQRVLIRPHGSGKAYAALTAPDPKERADVGMSSSVQPKLQQDPNLVEYVIALDAVAVIVNPANSVREMTLDEVRDIFSPNSARTDWPNLKPIHTYGRNIDSGTTESFRVFTGIDKLLKARGKDPKTVIPYSGIPAGREGHEGFEDTQKVIDQVAADELGIGYVGRAASVPTGVEALRIRPAPGYSAFRPTKTTIATMEYAMSRELYIYTARDARGLALAFAKFCVSDAGQKVVNDAGFVGFRAAELIDLNPTLGDRAPRDLIDRVGRWYGRIRITFHFKPDKDDLDTLSEQNMRLLEDFLRLPDNANRKLAIVGSADSIGTPERNLILSRNRARKFADTLAADGVPNLVTETLGYGKDYLLYDDGGKGDSLQAQRNRRVEIYFSR